MKTYKELAELGYKMTSDADKYMVFYKDEFIHGAGVKLPREKPLHWKHAKANRKDNYEPALRCAQRDAETRGL